MKILAIRIKNLASLEGFTELNFQEEPLFSAGIYAITGPTGAGKSTILDALCLALYDNTPRYRNAESHVKIADITGNTINQNDARGILRDGTAEGSAEVDFVGIDGQHYRAQWSVRRARNRIDGNLQSSVISLTNLTTNTEIPGKKTELLTEIERLAGLNFEQFTRSVLLAQGDFTAFLKAGKDEKSSLLEKLTGTHVYSKISQKVYEMHSEQKQKLQNMSIQQQGITILTEEELSELLNEIKSFELQIGADELQLGKLSNAIHWYEQLNKFKEGLNLAKTIHEQSQNKSIEAEPRRKQLQKIFYVQSVRENVNEFDSVRENIEK
ncbi:MAG: AAA family ATPase, partial [Chitinophagaceae bacterium]|nr:AAA family ATPase [Chitinophagaceae bacterium]